MVTIISWGAFDGEDGHRRWHDWMRIDETHSSLAGRQMRGTALWGRTVFLEAGQGCIRGKKQTQRSGKRPRSQPRVISLAFRSPGPLRGLAWRAKWDAILFTGVTGKREASSSHASSCPQVFICFPLSDQQPHHSAPWQ